MNWLNYMFDLEHKQRQNLLQNSREIQCLQNSLSQCFNSLESRLKSLEFENVELKLMNLVLLQVLLENELVTESKLNQIIQEIAPALTTK